MDFLSTAVLTGVAIAPPFSAMSPAASLQAVEKCPSWKEIFQGSVYM
jgi:hypothetical protein